MYKDLIVSKRDIYRVLGIVGRLSLSNKARNDIASILGEQLFNEILAHSISKQQYNFATTMYHYFLENDEYDLLERFFNYSIGFSSEHISTVFNPFSNDGRWVESFKETLYRDDLNTNSMVLMAGKSINHSNTIDEFYDGVNNGLTEVPKGSVSLLLFNPPSENVTEYLKSIVEHEVIYKSNSHGSNGKMVLAIHREELLNNLSCLLENFDIDEDLIYQTDGFFMAFATIKNYSIDITNSNELQMHWENMQRLENVINSNPIFTEDSYNCNFNLPSVPFERLKSNHEAVKKGVFNVSESNGDGWNWLQDLTSIEDNDGHAINKPTNIKLGEMSNIIASGMINGEMNAHSEEGYHVVAGGTKKRFKQELVEEEGKDNEVKRKTKTVLYSQPYLNLLINENGKLKIKELEGGYDLE